MAMKGRRGSKMSQAELGEAVGVSGSQIGFYETEANEPGWDGWVALGGALGVTPGWLAFEQEPRETAFASPYRKREKGRTLKVAEKGKPGREAKP